MDKIICLGKNYQDHIIEMKDKPTERPVLFLKPPSTLIEVKDNASIVLPWERGLIHHECEVVLKLYKKNVIGVALGLDLTLRDVQKKLKENGHPWEISKVFKNASVVTTFKAARDFAWETEEFILKVNGEVRQKSSLKNAIMNANEMIHYVDEFFPMNDGDLIFTGTPSGVGPLKPNDVVQMIYGPIDVTFKLSEV